MGYIAKWRQRKAESESRVEVSEVEGVRSLHLGSHTVQSSMRVSAPNDLELAYSRAMMAFLLFQPKPQKLLFVGLGGGSLQKFVYHRLPWTHSTTLEIDPMVVAAARNYFHVPEEDERFTVRLGDAAVYLCACGDTYDVLMVDGYDGVEQPEVLGEQAFYDDCAAALGRDGVFAVNLWGSDKRFGTYLQRIETSFDGNVLVLPTGKRANTIVFGFRRNPGPLRWRELKEKARELELAYGLEFPHFVEAMRDFNLHTERHLLL